MIILTGASGGIGSAISPILADMDELICLYNRNKPNITNINTTVAVKLNLLDVESINTFVREKKNILNKITIIHCAANKIDKLAIEYNESDWDDVVNLNLKSNYLLTKSLLPLMIEQGWGRIISISSSGAVKGAPGTLSYSASKTGLIGLTRVYATEYARFNITANILSLGYFQCGMYEKLSQKDQNKLKQEIPSKQLGRVENIGYAVDFLIRSEFTNGATICIDGGI